MVAFRSLMWYNDKDVFGNINTGRSSQDHSKKGYIMLAVQYIRIYWEKDNRSPEGAVKRRSFLRPYRIPETVQLAGDKNMFLQKLSFYQQHDGEILTEDENIGKNRYILSPEHTDPDLNSFLAHHQNMRIAEIREHNNGRWYDSADELVIPGVEIFESDAGYEVYWHYIDKPTHKPFRNGYNANYDRKGSRVKGRRLKCERAFILGNGEAGVLNYNYRVDHSMTGYEGQHYEQYCIYIVNTDKIGYNTFTSADYTNKYDEMAHLF